MAALTATTLAHKTAVTLAASPGVASAASGGDTVPNGGSTILFMNNTAVSSGTVTITTTATVDDQPVDDLQFTIPASTMQVVLLGPVNVYGTSTRVDCSATTIKLLAYTL